MPRAAQARVHSASEGRKGSRARRAVASRPGEAGRLRRVMAPGLVAGGKGASSRCAVAGGGLWQGGREAARADLCRGRVHAV